MYLKIRKTLGKSFLKSIPRDQKMSISSPGRVTAQSMEDLGQTEPVSLGTQKHNLKTCLKECLKKYPR